MRCSNMQLNTRWILRSLSVGCVVLGLIVFASIDGWSQEAEQDVGAGAKMAVDAEGWAKKYPEVFEGVNKFKQNDLTAALEQFEGAVKKYPELPPAELILASLYLKQNRINRAVNALDTAARKYAEDPETYLLLGNLAFQQNRNTEAALNFEKARTLLESYDGDSMRLKRLQLRLYAGLATLAERFDDWQTANPYLREWVNLDPQNSGARVRYARSLFRNNRGREAVGQLQYAKKNDASILSPSILMAQFWMEAGNMEAGRQWLERASNQQSEDLATQLMLARFHWGMRQFPEAKKSVAQALKLSEDDADANLLAGKMFHYDHNYEKAIEHLRKLVGDESTVPDAIRKTAEQHLMYALAAEGKKEGIEEAITMADSRADLSALVAACYAQKRAGNKEKALATLQAAQHTTEDPDTNYVFAYVLSDEVSSDKVLPLLEAALATDSLFVFRRDAEQLKARIASSMKSKKEEKKSDAE